MTVVDKFEEYRLFVEDTARFSDRRQAASNFMVAVNGFLVAGFALLVTEAGHKAWWLTLVALLLLAAGIIVCVIWLKLISRYSKMIQFRCDQLEWIESEIVGSHQMYRKIGEAFPDNGFSGIEVKLPCVFIGLYSLFAIGVLTRTAVFWHGRIVHALLRFL